MPFPAGDGRLGTAGELYRSASKRTIKNISSRRPAKLDNHLADSLILE